MGAIIGIGSFLGVKLDEHLQYDTPVYTIIFTLVAVFSAIYYFVKDFIK
jgi:hypothetical protein